MKKLSLNFTKILLAMSVTVVTSCFSTPVNQNKKPVINVNKNSKPVLNNIATVPSQQPTNNNLEKSEINLIFDWSGIPDILLKNKTESISLRISGQDFSPNLYKELNISENLDLFTQGLKVEIPQGKDRQIEVLAMDKDKFPIARVINKLDISGNQNVNLSFEKIPENKVEFNNNEDIINFVPPEWFGEEITEINHEIHENLGLVTFDEMKERYRQRGVVLEKVLFSKNK